MQQQSQSQRSQSSGAQGSAKRAKSQANETSLSAGEESSETSSFGASLTEKAPELIQDVVQYLENNWGLRKVEKVAAALGVGSAIDIQKIADTVMTSANWSAIKRRVTSKPAQAAAIAVAAVGIVVLARQLMADRDVTTSGKMHH